MVVLLGTYPIKTPGDLSPDSLDLVPLKCLCPATFYNRTAIYRGCQVTPSVQSQFDTFMKETRYVSQEQWKF